MDLGAFDDDMLLHKMLLRHGYDVGEFGVWWRWYRANLAKTHRGWGGDDLVVLLMMLLLLLLLVQLLMLVLFMLLLLEQLLLLLKVELVLLLFMFSPVWQGENKVNRKSKITKSHAKNLNVCVCVCI